MQIIENELHEIIAKYHILDDDTRNLLDDTIKKELEIIIASLISIRNQLNKYTPSQTKLANVLLENKKELAISKSLFPLYWETKLKIDNMTNDELATIV